MTSFGGEPGGIRSIMDGNIRAGAGGDCRKEFLIAEHVLAQFGEHRAQAALGRFEAGDVLAEVYNPDLYQAVRELLLAQQRARDLRERVGGRLRARIQPRRIERTGQG